MEEKIKLLMAHVFEVKPSEISIDLTADESPWWDSVKHLSLVTAIEEEFGIRMTMDEIQSMDTFAKILETINHHI